MIKRRHSIRFAGYDYSQNGSYFVTICTQNRENLFGKIKNGGMILNENGKIVESVWESLPEHYAVVLDCFQIMPNHIHMMIQIVGAGFPRPMSTLGQIIAYFKYQSAKQIRISQTGAKIPLAGAETAPLHEFVYIPKIFQRNYYERIIRDEPEYTKICFYITHNPEMWDRDRNNVTVDRGN